MTSSSERARHRRRGVSSLATVPTPTVSPSTRLALQQDCAWQLLAAASLGNRRFGADSPLAALYLDVHRLPVVELDAMMRWASPRDLVSDRVRDVGSA